ncbi:MAG: Glu-tRNA(Gln) amidotransferase subunit GatE [Ignavibacteriales bacterium]
MEKFLFKPFSEMTPEDYSLIGFKSGLEIHQQLLTQKKLFCRCPAGIYNTSYNAEILRHMRPTLSEFGEYDGTALMEFKTKKEIIYQINRDTVCTYEMDDTPPFEINEEALDIALGIGMLYGCSIVDEIHIARKQYLDGSIPTGFQRTSIIALDGKIPYKDRHINIIQLSIEEDSCREVSDIGHRRVYRTDRLGMPLIETVTAPEMKTPQEVADVADICRKLVKSTGKVRTGIGSAREDVNVSVNGGTRIEIKGVPKIPMIPLLTYNEAMRQWNLLRLRDELKRRGITQDTFYANYEDVTRLLKKTYFQPVQNAISQGMIVRCVVLKGFQGLLNWQTQTDTYFSREISDRVRVIACLTTIPNIIHSDIRGETLASSDWQKIKKSMGATDDDTLVITWGNPTDSETAAREIIIRAKEATMGIPSETRQALRDGTNGFERILPGPDRMYPDTDLPPRKITQQRLDLIGSGLPNPVWEREAWYRKLNVPRDLIEPLAISSFAALFEKAVIEWKTDPVLAAVCLIQLPKRLKGKGINAGVLTEETFESLFRLLKEGIIAREAMLPLLKDIALNGGFEPGLVRPICTEEELVKAIDEAGTELAKMKLYHPEKDKKILMGLVMNKLRGRIDGSDVAKRIYTVFQEAK